MTEDTQIIELSGRYTDKRPWHRARLEKQLNAIPKTAERLFLPETPSDVEWEILGDHFTSVKHLEVDSGFNEDLNDEKIPHHWPLNRLIIGGSCGELVRSPFILEGRVRHLTLMMTHGLRFDGGIREERQLASIESPSGHEVNLRKLEIIYNDALDTFNRFTLALPRVIEGVEVLNLWASPHDLLWTTEKMFGELLSQLKNLKTLVLTVGDTFRDGEFLPRLYGKLPLNLETFRFRGPVSLSESAIWQSWVDSFQKREFLPKLRLLSFVLDINGIDTAGRWLTDGDFVAREACSHLWDAARERGVEVQSFQNRWSECSSALTPVDGLWDVL